VLINIPCNFQENLGFYLSHLDSVKVCATDLTKSLGETQSLDLIDERVKVLAKSIHFFEVLGLILYKLLHENLHIKYLRLLIGVEK
jgi:citrate synthase